MFRVTQSYLVQNLVTSLKANGWDVLYQDYPDGQRNGIGKQGTVFHCFKSLFDEFPDVLCVRYGTLMIIEVDNKFKLSYIEKLSRFKSRMEDLVSCLFGNINERPNEVKLVIAISAKNKQIGIASDIQIWYYDKIKDKFHVY